MSKSTRVIDEKRSKARLLATSVAIIVLATWVFTPMSYWFGEYYPLIEVENRGEFGDSFGAVNSLFTGLALIGLVYTAYLQQLDIEQQQAELKTQNTTLNAQRFEHSFFSMVNVFNDVANSVDLQSAKHDRTTGRACLKIFSERLVTNIKGEADLHTALEINIENESDIGRLRAHYDHWWEQHRTELSHYFRTLYNIIKFVDEANISSKEKRKYTNIVRALLSDQEQVLLFYNCLGTAGAGFRKLTGKYELVKHTPNKLLADRSHKTSYYSDIEFDETL